MADGSTKAIENIEVGDRVLGRDEKGESAVNTVQKLIQPISNNMCQINLAGSEPLRVTNSHPLATTNGWKAIDVDAASLEKESVAVTKLMIGDRLIKDDGSNPFVLSINCWGDNVQTYNFTVDNSHTYFAQGYLAHNKGASQGPVCGGTTVLTCGNPANFVSSVSDGAATGWTTNTNLAKCMNRGLCWDQFPSQHEVTGCDNNENKGICRDNCGCCQPGEEYKATVVDEGIYWNPIDCGATITSLFCDDWDDRYTGEPTHLQRYGALQPHDHPVGQVYRLVLHSYGNFCVSPMIWGAGI
ncbi:MAG: hypothetical protein HND47_05450 [Chloroflexi bacterium]|nr:hypothetical protein [Chloroflexota bacterium]